MSDQNYTMERNTLELDSNKITLPNPLRKLALEWEVDAVNKVF